MEFTTKAQAIRDTGLTYLGSVSETVKHKKSIKYGELTYSLYLSPAKTSGYEVCPGRTAECTKFCLHESGQNRMVEKKRGEVITNSRIKKTKLFFEEKEFFMKWLIFEIKSARSRARRNRMTLSVRLNNTSDISPLDFELYGVNILEIFPDVRFYDYTKVPDRVELMKRYKNYDVTFSYNGYNIETCKKMLSHNVRVAMVFDKYIPDQYMGYKVINGDDYDMRYRDEPCIVGLKYKEVRTKLNTNIKFVIQ